MIKIILAGNATTANILSEYLEQDNRYEVVGLTVDDDFIATNGVLGIQSIPLSTISSIYNPQNHRVIMAMGYNDINRSRESMFNRLKAMSYQIESYVHPDAKVFTRHPLGEGCVIMPSAIIEPHVRLGANSMIWANVTLAHHSSVEKHCWVASGATISGQATVKRNSFIGVNATIVNEIIIDEYCIIGAGALITKNTKPSSVHLARSGEELRYSSQDYVKFFGV
ncbi:MAG: acetyltransferase [Tatlockia sp.]|nr:acetyltransferase [Tatlockia sp.]